MRKEERRKREKGRKGAINAKRQKGTELFCPLQKR